MGSGASTAKENGTSAATVEASGLLDGLDGAAPPKTAAIEEVLAQERLQKVAFDGDKPSWKDSYREYSTEHGINKGATLEWSDQPAPPKQRSFSSTGSAGSLKGTATPPARSKPPTPNAYTNPNVGKAAPPPNAGRSPIASHHTVVTRHGSAAPIAPSALGTPAPALEGAPANYTGNYSQRTQQSTASTVYSAASPMGGRHADPAATQTQRRPSAQSHDPSGGRSPLIGNSPSKHADPRSSQHRLSVTSDEGSVSAQSTAAGSGSKPPPPAGAPPRKLSRGESDIDGDTVLMADFSQGDGYIENMKVSSTAAKSMPALNLAPVAAQAAIRNQPPPKPGAMGLHTKVVPGMQLHSNYAVASNVATRPMPTKVAPPAGPQPGASQRGNGRGGPPKPTTPASVHAAGGGDLIAKKFPHSVKETSDVKRNRAQIPTQLTHAKPTTGDWLKKRYIVNNYILLDTLGTGSYGEVKLSKDRNTDKLFAVKIFSKDFLKKKKQGKTTETYEEDIRREIAIMKKLLHPNVLRLFEVLDDPKVNKMYLVLEYMKRGDLLHFLATREKDANAAAGKPEESKKKSGAENFPPVTERELWIIFRQVVQGVKYLHQHNIIHGDIKPHNLLMGDDGIIRIADFGISKMLEDAREKLEDATGTPAFMSPELCDGSASISGQLADVWAIGATMFMLLFGFPPFLAGSIINLYQKIINDPLVFPHAIDPSLSDLLEHMLEKRPENRYSLDEVIRHPWLKQPPTNYVPPQDKISTNNFGVWPPAPSYNKEADAAMNSPIKTADKDDMFMSILENTKTEEAKEDEDDDLMGTNWGADVFDQVDDADFNSGSDDEVESYDSDSVDSEPKPAKKPAIPSKLESNLPETRFSGVPAAEHKSEPKPIVEESAKAAKPENPAQLLQNRSASFINRQRMNEDEEKNRTMRFQKANAKKPAPEQKAASDSDSDYSDDEAPTEVKKKASTSMFDTIVASPNECEDAAPSRHAAPLAYKQPGVKPAKPLSVKLNAEGDDDFGAEALDELSMEDFNQLMDTLSNPVSKPLTSVETPTSQSPMVLSSVKVMDVSRNTFNGIGSACHTEKGQRPNQEDRFVMWPNIPAWSELNQTTGRLTSSAEVQPWCEEEAEVMKKLSVFGIFDGHSGSMCSEFLRTNLIPFVLRNREIFGKKIGKLLLESFDIIDEEVCDLLRQEVNSSGATSLVAVYDGRHNTFTVANTGDSMLILSRAGRAVRMHKMHRLDDLEEVDRIKKAGGVIVNRRVNGLLAISRALGDTQFKSTEGPSLVVSTPDVHTEIITPMTEFAILATDGLWDVIEAQDAVNFVRKRLGKKMDLQQIAIELVNAALDRGSVDNTTAIIVAFHCNSNSTPDKSSTK